MYSVHVKLDALRIYLRYIEDDASFAFHFLDSLLQISPLGHFCSLARLVGVKAECRLAFTIASWVHVFYYVFLCFSCIFNPGSTFFTTGEVDDANLEAPGRGGFSSGCCACFSVLANALPSATADPEKRDIWN